MNEVTRERAQSFLTDNNLVRVVEAYRDFKEEPAFTCVAPIEEIRAKDGNLSIPLYVSGESFVVREETGDYRTNNFPSALSGWLESFAAVRQMLDTLLSSKK